ncbi:hypothetical protein [Flagellimonas myxillae]|uniref:hypothetical protein n=1 Tax=Flagellimonas myxillae TaxID=2942214 RepID=UPI00201E759D|nr:hypothetical protein [Muricauda myxillae]MCL6264895.1 hypothetical protein [Muricauda myxillae]
MNTPTIVCSLFALVSIVTLVAIRKLFVTQLPKKLWLATFVFFALYLFIQITNYIRWEYFISPEKSADTARNFAFVTGGVYAIIATLFFLIIEITYSKFKNLRSQ